MSGKKTEFQSIDFIKSPYKNSICYIRESRNLRKHSNNFLELIKAIEFLTGDDFQKKPHHFVANQYNSIFHLDTNVQDDEKYTCLCSCDKCNNLYAVHHLPTNTYLAVGSVCITKFINEDFGHKLRCKEHNGACKKCEEPLCMKSSKHVTKNYNKNNNQICDDCLETTLFMSKGNIDYFKNNNNICFERLERQSTNIWVYYGNLPKCLHDYELTYVKIDYKYKDDVKQEYMVAWDADKKSWYCRKKDKMLIESYLRMISRM
jgi:hypothetical protein